MEKPIEEGNRYDHCVIIGPMIMMKFAATHHQEARHTHDGVAQRADGGRHRDVRARRVTVDGETRFTCVDGPGVRRPQG